jgi:hypothetical protein
VLALIAWMSAVGAGCIAARGGPPQHGLPLYREDPALAREVEAIAGEWCLADRGAPQPDHAFTTDGCSAFPDGGWAACCVEHDIVYWCGGTQAARLAADRALRACVAEVAPSFLASLMYAGVRVGGPPWTGAPWRWGYGFSARVPYVPEPPLVTDPAPHADPR